MIAREVLWLAKDISARQGRFGSHIYIHIASQQE